MVLAQVGDVEHEIGRVLGQLMLGMRERDPGEVLLRGVQVSGDVFQAAELERHLDRAGTVGQRFEEQAA